MTSWNGRPPPLGVQQQGLEELAGILWHLFEQTLCHRRRFPFHDRHKCHFQNVSMHPRASLGMLSYIPSGGFDGDSLINLPYGHFLRRIQRKLEFSATGSFRQVPSDGMIPSLSCTAERARRTNEIIYRRVPFYHVSNKCFAST